MTKKYDVWFRQVIDYKVIVEVDDIDDAPEKAESIIDNCSDEDLNKYKKNISIIEYSYTEESRENNER